MKGFLLGISLLALGVCYSPQATQHHSNTASSCRCQPDQPCWPPKTDWDALNASLEGNLLFVKPLAYPCHLPHYDASECVSVQLAANSSAFRSSQPGALYSENWGEWPTKQEQCYVKTPPSTPCGQGRIPVYAAVVRTAQDIQHAVRYAAHHNLKVAIRNTGHDFLGRSAAPGALQIFTHRMNDMTVHDAFVPVVPQGIHAPAGVRAVTLGAGVQLLEMYEYLALRGLMVVGGTARTVGIAGGYIQGGGHSLLGWLHGMGCDNVLQFQVVVADGTVVVANAYQNSDLFFALRGGGGGTFGVVVSVTVNAYPDPPVVHTKLSYTMPTADDAYWAGIEAVHRHLGKLNDAGATGAYTITPADPISDTQRVSTYSLNLVFVNQTDTSAVESLLSQALEDIKQSTGISPSYNIDLVPNMSKFYSALLGGRDQSHFTGQLGSRLLSRSLYDHPSGPARITNALSSLRLGPADYIQGLMSAGGRVSQNTNIDSGLNPAWRDTLVHLVYTQGWDPNTATPAEVVSISANMTNLQVPMLRALEPGKMGAYVNEADANEANFQESFWGPNYDRLYAIKQVRDPDGLFIVRKGVGSEDWDDQGICRLR
ncbi:hypothetical protein BJX99DRAFT_243898 [Aspergillus californicus]